MTFEVPINRMPRNQRRILQIFSGLGSIRVMPAMRLQFLREKLNLATDDDDIFVHILNNDLPRSSNYVGLARNFCDVLLEFRARKPHTKIFVSLLLPRFDGHGTGTGIVNSEIVRILGQIQNIFLIENNNFNQNHFLDDGLHLTSNTGFEILAANWLSKLGIHFIVQYMYVCTY